MPRRDLALRFALRLVVVYVLLVVPWPGLDAAFGRLYRGASNGSFRIVGLEHHLNMGIPPVYHPRGDIELKVTNPNTGAASRIEYGSRDWAFLPLAAGLALLVAVPPPWPRRFAGAALLLGMLLLFIGLRIALAATYGFTANGMLEAGPSFRRVLGQVMLAFSATPITSFVVPILLWLLVLYWTYDWSRFSTVDEVQAVTSSCEESAPGVDG